MTSHQIISPSLPASRLSPEPQLSAVSSPRHDGWTPERKRRFCEVLAECGRVEHAARAVGMDKSSAYRVRRRADAREFALGWDAALRLARQRLIDDAFELAFEGTHEIVTRDGVVIAERRRRDSGAVLSVLARLKDAGALDEPETRIVAQDFDGFLDRIDSPIEAAGEPQSLSDYLAARSGKRRTPPRDEAGQFLSLRGR